MGPIDRIDRRGRIREHLSDDGKRTACGLAIDLSQAPQWNPQCRRCYPVNIGRIMVPDAALKREGE